MSPAGRRRGKTDTASAVLDAARECFAENGYDGTTIRTIASKAGVDPALVHHFFGAKAELFVAAVDFPFVPRAILAALLEAHPDDAGELIVRQFLALWDDPTTYQRLLAVVRSAVRYEAAAVILRRFIDRELIGTFVRTLDTPDAEVRAALVGSQLIGLAVARSIVKLPALAAASTEQLVAAYTPTVQRYLTGNVGIV